MLASCGLCAARCRGGVSCRQRQQTATLNSTLNVDSCHSNDIEYEYSVCSEHHAIRKLRCKAKPAAEVPSSTAACMPALAHCSGDSSLLKSYNWWLPEYIYFISQCPLGWFALPSDFPPHLAAVHHPFKASRVCVNCVSLSTDTAWPDHV